MLRDVTWKFGKMIYFFPVPPAGCFEAMDIPTRSDAWSDDSVREVSFGSETCRNSMFVGLFVFIYYILFIYNICLHVDIIYIFFVYVYLSIVYSSICVSIYLSIYLCIYSSFYFQYLFSHSLYLLGAFDLFIRIFVNLWIYLVLVHIYIHLEPETSTLKWLFQLDDSKSLHRKWLFHQTSIYKWLFRVPGTT